MYSFLSRYGQLLGLGLGLLITILFFLIIAASGETLATNSDVSDKAQVKALADSGIFNIGIYGAFLLTVLCSVLMLGFGVFGIVQDPKGSLKSLAGFGALLVIFLIGYGIAKSMGDSDIVMAAIEKFNKSAIDAETGEKTSSFITAGKSSFISGSLITTIALGLLAFLGLVASEVMNLFR
jgi:hypothetical protein